MRNSRWSWWILMAALAAGAAAAERPALAQAPAAPAERVASVEAEMERISGAISALRVGLEGLSAKEQPAEWAAAQNRLGGLLGEGASYLGGTARSQILRESIAAYQEALKAIDQAQAVQEWSIVAYNLGSAQVELAESIDDPQEAMETFRAAAATLEPLPALLPAGSGMLRAAVLSHRGDALLGLGLLMPLPAEDGRLRIQTALALYAEAQKALPADASPLQRGMMAFSRGRAAAELATRQTAADAAATRDTAIAAYEEASAAFTREGDPELYVQIHQELGILRLQSAMAQRGQDSVAPAKAAAESFRRALAVVMREQDPDLWGSLQGGLGAALLRAGKSSPIADASAISQLEASTFAFRNLLGVLPREKDAQVWAQTQHNLGTALRELGSRQEQEPGIEPLRRSLAAYRSALEVITREKDEAAWAETQLNLIVALRELARRLEPSEASDLVDEASERMEEARPVLERLGTADLPADTAVPASPRPGG